MLKISTIAVVTNDQFFRDASTYFLSQQYTLLDIGHDEKEIGPQLSRQPCPDVIILHAGYGSALGTAVVKHIADNQLPTKILAYHDEASPLPVPTHAFLTRADGLEAMLRGIALLEEAPAPATHAPDPLLVLTPQELKVLGLIGLGWGSGQIAAQLFISVHTIKNHKTNIRRKLIITSSRELLAIALKLRSHSGKIERVTTTKSIKLGTNSY